MERPLEPHFPDTSAPCSFATMILSLQTVQEFDQSSGKLTRWLIVLTVLLVVLTGVITYFTVLLANFPKK